MNSSLHGQYQKTTLQYNLGRTGTSNNGKNDDSRGFRCLRVAKIKIEKRTDEPKFGWQPGKIATHQRLQKNAFVISNCNKRHSQYEDKRPSVLALVSASQHLEEIPHKSCHCLRDLSLRSPEQSCFHLDLSPLRVSQLWKPAIESEVTEQFIN